MNRLLLLLTITLSGLTWAQSKGRCAEPINPANTQTAYNRVTTPDTDAEDVISKVVRGEEIVIANKPSQNNVTAKKRTIIIVQEEKDGVFVTTQINLAGDAQTPPQETTPCRGVDDSRACRPKGRN